MVDVRILGCGWIQLGNGAVASFYEVHILGKNWPVEVLNSNCHGRAKLDRLSFFKKSYIPQSTIGCLVGRQIGRGMERRLCLWRQIIEGRFDTWEGGKTWPIATGWPISMGPPSHTP